MFQCCVKGSGNFCRELLEVGSGDQMLHGVIQIGKDDCGADGTGLIGEGAFRSRDLLKAKLCVDKFDKVVMLQDQTQSALLGRKVNACELGESIGEYPARVDEVSERLVQYLIRRGRIGRGAVGHAESIGCFGCGKLGPCPELSPDRCSVSNLAAAVAIGMGWGRNGAWGGAMLNGMCGGGARLYAGSETGLIVQWCKV